MEACHFIDVVDYVTNKQFMDQERFIAVCIQWLIATFIRFWTEYWQQSAVVL